jgi:putative two-component system response regulator
MGIDLKQAKILSVDDEKANLRFLEIILRQAGYTNFHGTTDAREVLPLFTRIQPDILLLDLHMPYLNGINILQQLREEMANSPIPVLVLTADSEAATKYKAFREGATDFLIKPLDEMEVLLRIDNLLRVHFHSVLLEEKVRERTLELEKSQLDTLQRLAWAAEYRDDETGLHAERVGVTSACIADAMGFPARYVDMILRAAPLHDIGKIGIADCILRKPGKLTAEEFAVMQQHTVIGARILSGSSSPILQLAEEIAHFHHERWDGRGYCGLQGTEIPVSGRIVTVADQFDALTHDRPYKEAWSVEEAVLEINAQSDCQFDARVVVAFLTLSHKDLI